MEASHILLPMFLEDFHCDMLDVSLGISAEDFDKDAFLKEIGVENESEYVDDEGQISLSLSFNDRKDASKQHAHIRVLFHPDKPGTAVLNYHQTGENVPDNKPPYLDDCAQWFGQFFKSEEQTARIHVAYEFGKGFVTVIPLPFPLVATSKALSGLKVNGLSLQYPDDVEVESAILQREEDEIYLFVEKNSVIKLKEYDPFKELVGLAEVVDSLVKEQEKTSGDSQKKRATVRKKR